MNETRFSHRQFKHYSFTELDTREVQFGITCDGAAWPHFIREIRKHGGVMAAIAAMLRERENENNLSNQFTLLLCCYNSARRYAVSGGLQRQQKCSPETFIHKVERLACEDIPLTEV